MNWIPLLILIEGIFPLISCDFAGRVRVPLLDGKIVGGKETSIEEHPYQLSLQYDHSHICGASLIKPTVALTAAHCTDGRTAEAFTIRGGTSTKGRGGEVVSVKCICQHPKFNYYNVDYDVSVLLLKKALSQGDNCKTIALQPAKSDVSDGTLATVTGWGTLSSGGATSATLQEVDVPKVSDSSCATCYPKENITQRMICFGYTEGGKDSCQGDSGGPLVFDGKQVGIVSWGYGCARPSLPGVYTRLSNEEISSHIETCSKKFKSC